MFQRSLFRHQISEELALTACQRRLKTAVIRLPILTKKLLKILSVNAQITHKVTSQFTDNLPWSVTMVKQIGITERLCS